MSTPNLLVLFVASFFLCGQARAWGLSSMFGKDKRDSEVTAEQFTEEYIYIRLLGDGERVLLQANQEAIMHDYALKLSKAEGTDAGQLENQVVSNMAAAKLISDDYADRVLLKMNLYVLIDFSLGAQSEPVSADGLRV